MSVFTQLGDTGEAPQIRRLSRRSSSYLQTIVGGFALTRVKEGLQLQLKIEDDPLTIVDGRGKRDLERISRGPGLAAREQLRARIEALTADTDLMGYRIDCSNWPMRYANGGVLPIVHFEERDYFLLFYRDIFPVGWNIANGASDDEDEWVDPGRIIHREFAEEVLFADPTEKLLYVYEPAGGGGRFGFHRDALSAWRPHRPELESYRRVPMPFKWIDGPDSIRVEYGREVYEDAGFFLSVTPDDHGIEVDRLVLIRLPGDTRLLSGEIAEGRPFNHIVGLFDVARLEGIYSGREFLPDVCFFNGERYAGGEFSEVLPRYLRYVREPAAAGFTPLRRDDQIEFYDSCEVRFDFCPITRAIIGRYYQWNATEPASVPAEDLPPPPARAAGEPSQHFEVFISHVSKHREYAHQVHDALGKRLPGRRVFLSDRSLVEQGESNYRMVIERALSETRCLIVLLLEPDDRQSGWLNYEWMTFDSEIIAGRKQGSIFTLMDRRLGVSDLPLGLRRHEFIGCDRQAPQAALERLCSFVARSLS